MIIKEYTQLQWVESGTEGAVCVLSSHWDHCWVFWR